MHNDLRTAILLAVTALTAACSGSGDGAPDSAAEQDAPAGAVTSGAQANTLVDFTASDLEAYERGIARETELVRASQQPPAGESTPESRAAARRAGEEDATIPEGARAAGLDESRYRAVRHTVHETLKMLSFQRKIDGPMRYDTARADAEMKARLARDPIADLPSGAAEALRARLDRVVPVWSSYIRLTAVGG